MGARLSKRVLTTGAIAGALTLITAGAVAAAPSNPFRHDGGLIAACVGPDGDARITRSFQHCRPGERELVWNEQGRPGIQGPTGAPGGTGAAGAQGIQGLQGVAGPSLNDFSPVLEQALANPSFPGPDFQDIPATATVSAPMTINDLTLTIPATGTYEVNANFRGRVFGATAACFIVADLATISPANVVTPVANSQRAVVYVNAGVTDAEATAPIQALLVSLPAGTKIVVRAFQGGTCPAAPTTTGTVADANGTSTINAVRIN